MIRIVLRSKENDDIFCYDYIFSNRMDEAERLATTYSIMAGVKAEIEVA
tara:strand:+ start:114 stop:260 length:147 start_codon:yes stop_codon:yes gene_type:complete